ncbi:MAG: DNA polymerase III subunit beta, partial [Microcoleaceae cyanobacterium]
MKFICSQADLNTHLSLVSRAVPSRPSHPVLANVLLIADADEQTVELTGFDLSLGIRTSFAAMVTASGSLTIPAKIFNDIISKLSGGDLTIEENTEDESVISIISDSGRYQVRGMSADEFPELPLIEDGEVVYLPPDDLISGLRGTLFAASPDETKQVLTGVHLKVEKDELEFAATDGHRLALVQTPSETSVESELEMTIPAKALREVERMLMANQALETVGLRFDESQIVFEIGTQKLTSRKLEGQYPVYR